MFLFCTKDNENNLYVLPGKECIIFKCLYKDYGQKGKETPPVKEDKVQKSDWSETSSLPDSRLRSLDTTSFFSPSRTRDL